MSEDQNWLAAKIIGPKKEWRAYKARVKALPAPYAEAVASVERYVMHFGGVNDATSAQSLFNDVIDIFERAAADNTPIRDVVGDDPVEFADALIRNYQQTGYVAKEQQRLRDSISRAAGEQS